jgi:3-oxoadipate enol-lactonase
MAGNQGGPGLEFARIGSLTLCYSVTPAGPDRPWLVFVNALGTDHRVWDGVIAALGREWNLLAYDMRGHGLSDAGEAPYAMDDHVGDLEALLTHLEIATAVLCGVSVGGMIAQGLAARRPELVVALILCDTGARIGNVDTWNARLEAVRARGIASVADAVTQRWFTEDFRKSEPAFTGYRNMLVQTSVAGYTGTVAALRDTDYTEQAKALSLPVLCLVGAEDEVTSPAQTEELAQLFDGARIEVIGGAAHQPHIERPREVAGPIAAFLQEIGHV